MTRGSKLLTHVRQIISGQGMMIHAIYARTREYVANARVDRNEEAHARTKGEGKREINPRTTRPLSHSVIDYERERTARRTHTVVTPL